MNLEQIGIAALCVSQAGVWIAQHRANRAASQRDRLRYKMLDGIESRALRAANAAEDSREMLRDCTERERGLLDANRAFCELRDEIRAALDRMPRKRNKRRVNPDAPIDLVPSTPLAPLERSKRTSPNDDVIGKVSS
jgi:hypothetical protein